MPPSTGYGASSFRATRPNRRCNLGRITRLALCFSLLVLLTTLVISCGDDDEPASTTAVRGSGTEQPVLPTRLAATPPVALTVVANVCGPNPSPAQRVQPTDFGFRELDRPRPGDSTRGPLEVSGRANPFEGAFSVSIFDAAGRPVATRDFSKDNRQPAFSVQLPFTVSAPTPACVWVHERSGRDGSPVNVTQVPVTLLP